MWLIGFLLYELLCILASLLPLRLSYAIADCICLGSYLFHRSRTQNLRSNIETVMMASARKIQKEKIDRLTLHATINFGRSVVDTLLIRDVEKRKIKNRFEIVGSENLEKALAKGKGAVIATAHLGSWEIAGALLSTMGYRIATVAGVQFNRFLSEFVIRSKIKKGIMVFSYKHLLAIFRETQKGSIVVLHVDGDQFLGGIPVRFFQRETLLPRGPAALAKATQSPLLCAVSIRKRAGIKIIFFEEIPVQGRSDIEIMQDVVALIERQIADNPGQWLMFRKIWRSKDEDRSD
ncbi:MAG: lysophospholipid acyltransferase family protein [bacterium]